MTFNLPTVGSLALALSASLLPLSVPVPTLAQGAYPAESQRTVEYYVQHPDVRSQVNRACLNDPGHLRSNADCWNATQANLEAVAREGQRGRTGDAGNPLKPAYWTARPHDRAFKLGYCNRETPEQRAASSLCVAAAQSAALEH